MANQYRTKTVGFLTMTAFIAVALSGCVAEDAEASSLYVKDSLTDDAAEVHVTFTEIQVLPAQASQWITVYQGEESVDLLSLSAPEAKEKLSDLDLSPGAYDGLRIAASKAHVVLHNGTTVDLTIAGNVISLAESFEVSSAGGLQILVDFDLERSVDLDGQVYAATVKEMRTSAEDIDDDGVPDFDDTDDPGRPEPAQQRHNGFGLCVAWENSAQARENNNTTMADSSAFENLSRMAAEQNQTTEEYCATQEFPGPPGAVPEEARAYYEEAMERREQREGNAGGAGQDARPDDNRTAGNQSSGQQGNQSDDQQGGQQGDDQNGQQGGQPTATPTGRPDGSEQGSG